MWGQSEVGEIYKDYQNGQNLTRVFNRLKSSVVTTAKCDESNESGKVSAGAKMPSMKKQKKEKKKRAPQRDLPPCPTFDMLGSTINMIGNQMMMMGDGFELSLQNIIADNGNMAMGVQGDSYFSLRHQMVFEGPLGFLMSGGQRDYVVECIAQNGPDSTLVANWTPSQGMMDGQWENKWSKNIATTFQFAVTSSDDRRLAMMLPNYSGKITWNTSLHNFTLGKGQQGGFFLSSLHRILPNLMLGSKLNYNGESGSTSMTVGGQYRMKGNKPGQMEVFECRLGSKAVTGMYTRQISKHATLATKCNLQFGSKSATSSIFYKYLFGSEQMGSQIMGEITSNFTCKTIFMMPFLSRFMLRCTGEMNHFDYNPKLGQVPHKFGFNIMMQF